MPRRGRPTVEIMLSGEERKTLERWARRHSSSQALALRCRIVLASAEGRTNTEIAADLGVNQVTVSKWRHRFAADRLDGLVDAPRPGAVRTIGDDVIEAVLVETLETTPPDATHWSTRGLARKHGISHQTVAEIWHAFGLKPWRQDSFKVSPDPQLVEKIRDLVALYMNPPVAAAVFAVDEKPQIQALNRTAPTLPMLPTTPQRATHDYERNGTCDLFAALNLATGQVVQTIWTLYNGTGEHSAVERYSTWQQVKDSMASNDRLLGLLLALFGIIALIAAPCAIANVTAGRVLGPARSPSTETRSRGVSGEPV